MNVHRIKDAWMVFALSVLASSVALAEEVLWRSGENLYIKLVAQDESDAAPNEHPVVLKAKDITDALNAMEFWDKAYLKGKTLEQVFVSQQTQLLGRYVSEGLAKAEPNQDIVFALVGRRKGMLSNQEIRYMAGRVFYEEGRLNLIIGDYDKTEDKGLEAMYSSTGTQKVRYHFTVGYRGKASRFDRRVIAVDGLSFKSQDNKKRKDWMLLDLEAIQEHRLATLRAQESSDVQQKTESLEIARERREMRAELARIRKDIEAQRNQSSEQSSIEDRLLDLQSLKTKGLISEEEYIAKREAILAEI